MTQVLLVMDFQNGILSRFDTSTALENVKRAIEAARKKDVPVMFVRVAFRAGFPEVSESNQAFSAARNSGNAMHQSDEATQVHPSLDPQPDEPIVVKRRVSAFTGSDLDVLLRGAGADSLVLAGISTSGVVLSTLRQAADLDHRITVLEDACADADPEVHRVLAQKVFPRQAQVTSTDEWIASL